MQFMDSIFGRFSKIICKILKNSFLTAHPISSAEPLILGVKNGMFDNMSKYAFIDVQNTDNTTKQLLGFIVDWQKLYDFLKMNFIYSPATGILNI